MTKETTGKYQTSEVFLFDSLKKNQDLNKDVVLNSQSIRNLKQLAFDVDLLLQSINQR